jgi:SAM-dependent methyltransferase
VISEERFRRKLPFRARGLDALERHVGAIVAEVDARLARRGPVRILELGCGWGTALLELRARYGARVELHGLNRVPDDGDSDVLLRNAAEGGLPLDAASLPALHYADVARGLPFPDGRFDIVYSQVAWLYFANKVGVLQEVIRVLADGGLAAIDADELRSNLPPEYARLVEIWEDGRLVPLGAYVSRFGMALASAPEGAALRLHKCVGFGDDLDLVAEIDTNRLHAHWDGIKCVYRLRRLPRA